jgi:hypothetical protein
MEPTHKKAEMAYMFYGGHKNLERTRALQKLFRSNPNLVNQWEEFSWDLAKKARYDAKITRELITLHKAGILQEFDHNFNISIFTAHAKVLQTHFTLFLPMFLAFSSSEQDTNPQKLQQRQFYLNQIKKLEIIGSCLLGELNLNNGGQCDNPFEV